MYAVLNEFCIYWSALLLLEIMLFFFLLFLCCIEVPCSIKCGLQHDPELLWGLLELLSICTHSSWHWVRSRYILERNKKLCCSKELAFYYLLLSKGKNVKTVSVCLWLKPVWTVISFTKYFQLYVLKQKHLKKSNKPNLVAWYFIWDKQKILPRKVFFFSCTQKWENFIKIIWFPFSKLLSWGYTTLGSLTSSCEWMFTDYVAKCYKETL